MKLLNKLSIIIVILALCFLCAPTLSFAQFPSGHNGDGDRPKPPVSMSGRIAGDSGLDDATRLDATLNYIEYDLSEAAFVEIWIYDEKGMVRQLLRNDWQPAGAYGLAINHDALPTGIYSYDIIINDILFTRRFIKDRSFKID